MRIYRLLLLFVIGILFAQTALAGSGHTTLLATSEPFEGGVTADLFLETKPGTGKIFIESFPLTKVDTQISTRFAKEVACSYLGKSCDELDFFYTIKADAVIIGGPSAGAAMATLTVAVLEGVELNETVAITGTINSGNVIGHVGGISEKIEAASDAGIKKVLIPKGERSNFARNISIDMVEYGRDLGIEIVEVFSLDEAVQEFTGKTFTPDDEKIEVDTKYSEVMKELAAGLCRRTERLKGNVESSSINRSLEDAKTVAENLSQQGVDATAKGSFYAAASFCFGANVRYKFLDLISEELSDEDILSELENVNERVDEIRKNLKNASTVSDAQILAIVLDRLTEAERHTNVSATLLNQQRVNSIYELAFSIERIESATAWSQFFEVMGESAITEDVLKNACISKLAEAQERIEYASILLRGVSESSRLRLAEAQAFVETKDYVQCLHKATLSKSEANTLLSVFGVRDEEIEEIVDRKLTAARTSIARQKEIFPIVGYSYYEYANSLKDTDKYSALLFLDYALEFSNIDIYFKDSTTQELNVTQVKTAEEATPVAFYFIAGIALGIVLTIVLKKATKRKKKRILINRAKKKIVSK
ncbi:hypothetical protein CMO88_02885 [Candidatus Woesearchaeota archaeon]|nr:hypothetical protein [Candidatus Woesearchaeota archaeon]|tara:strand:+ start:3382 stop:5163 length:1782 start_codon:yes stop_codon:yes gene_type:complete